jgi:hypothetical protein
MNNILNLRGYGDLDNLKIDIARLNDILNRQSTTLIIDVIAEYCGDRANKFKLSDAERQALAASMVADLKNALLERL